MSKLLSRLSERLTSPSSEEYERPRDGSGPTVSARRREQVRRAQRTHRERKAEYVKALETEIAELRSKEAANTSYRQRCAALIQSLVRILRSNNIVVPTEVEAQQSQLNQLSMTTIEVVGGEGEPQRLRASTSTSETSFSTSSPPPPSLIAGGIDSLNLNNPQLGIDFILTLEQPCLAHFHPKTNEDGDGHSMMFQAPLVARAPQSDTKLSSRGSSGSSPTFSPGQSWTIPTIELENQLQTLLAYSQNLSLAGEITPVLAWYRLKQHPQASMITSSKLMNLANALLANIVCYGFGAVLDEDIFVLLLEEVVRQT